MRQIKYKPGKLKNSVVEKALGGAGAWFPYQRNVLAEIAVLVARRG